MRTFLSLFKRPPSGSIPRFPVWEVTVMAFVTYYGIVSLLTPDSGTINALLGEWSFIWSISLILSGGLSLIGLASPAPNGLIVNLVGVLVLTIAATAVAAGIAVLRGNLFFGGSTSLYVFAFGGLWRSIQILYQLSKLQQQVTVLAKIRSQEDSDGCC